MNIGFGAKPISSHRGVDDASYTRDHPGRLKPGMDQTGRLWYTRRGEVSRSHNPGVDPVWSSVAEGTTTPVCLGDPLCRLCTARACCGLGASELDAARSAQARTVGQKGSLLRILSHPGTNIACHLA